MKRYFKYLIYLFVVFGVSASYAGSYEDFFSALERDDARTVSQLLARGFDPNSPDPTGQVGLFLALRSESAQLVAVLLAHPDIKVDAANRADETPLMMAALRGDLKSAQRLVEKGAQINRGGWTPLHYAASGPGTPVVAWLLERGARIDAPSPSLSTPLMMAAGYGAIDSATLLVQRGADARLRNDAGLTAADFALRAGRGVLAKALEQGAR